MRQSFKNVEIIEIDGVPVGLSLGFDWCAEHEWGINGIQGDFGVGRRGDLGIDKRLVCLDEGELMPIGIYEWPKSTKTLPAETRLLGGFAMRFDGHLLQERKPGRMLPVRRADDRTIEASWDARSFCVRAFGDAERDMLRDIYAAFIAQDVAIGQSRGDVFGGSGLVLVIASRLPQAVKDKIYADDLDAKNLQESAVATGIAEKLEAAGKRYFALSPKWIDGFERLAGRPDEAPPRERSAHRVIFWLNPYEQRANNYGWFTVEELEAWIEGKGPIPKKKDAA